jgi:Putative collagen-binding domain of a collagenase
VILETETKLGGPRHLIAQNFANGRAKIEQPDPAVSLFNFHYATPPDVIALNANLRKAIGDDETGFRGTNDRVYRSEAWEFLLAGGSTFSNLDYSYTVEHPDGRGTVEAPTPGEGGPSLRMQLSILRDFLAGFDFVHMVPDRSVIKRGVPEKARAEVLALRGRAYAIYLNSGTHADLVLDLPAGRYRANWINPRTGAVESAQDIDHPSGEVTLDSPRYDEDIALKIVARR